MKTKQRQFVFLVLILISSVTAGIAGGIWVGVSVLFGLYATKMDL